MPSALFPGLVERDDFFRPIASLAQEFGILLGSAEERLTMGTASQPPPDCWAWLTAPRS
jgi:hypothetical protein